MSIRRVWTIQQDNILKILKQERNIKKWSSIARIMDFQFNMCGRNGKQCRERYNNHLSEGIIENKLSFSQQKLLESLNDQIGNKWAVISKHFSGRTANFLKNQLYSKLRKSIRKINKFMKQMKLNLAKPYNLNVVYKIVQSNDFKIFQKQRHKEQDLKLYQDVKNKLFEYAQQSLVFDKQETSRNTQFYNLSKNLIENLNKFIKKYQSFQKKTKKPRKKYFCQDDVVLNSLSNNRSLKNGDQKNYKIYQQKQQKQQENQRIPQDQEQSSTSVKKNVVSTSFQPIRLQLRFFQSRNFDNYKQKQQEDHPFENTPKNNNRQVKTAPQIQKMANENCKIVEQQDVQSVHKGYRLLQQSSQQRQMIDIEYLQHFNSCSLIDEALFQ